MQNIEPTNESQPKGTAAAVAMGVLAFFVVVCGVGGWIATVVIDHLPR